MDSRSAGTALTMSTRPPPRQAIQVANLQVVLQRYSTHSVSLHSSTNELEATIDRTNVGHCTDPDT